MLSKNEDQYEEDLKKKRRRTRKRLFLCSSTSLFVRSNDDYLRHSAAVPLSCSSLFRLRKRWENYNNYEKKRRKKDEWIQWHDIADVKPKISIVTDWGHRNLKKIFHLLFQDHENLYYYISYSSEMEVFIQSSRKSSSYTYLFFIQISKIRTSTQHTHTHTLRKSMSYNNNKKGNYTKMNIFYFSQTAPFMINGRFKIL